MNAVAAKIAPTAVTLRLTPTKAMPRRLVVSWQAKKATAMLFSPDGKATLFASADAPHEICVLRVFAVEGDGCLALGSTGFDLTAMEVTLVAETFARHGLRVEQVRS